MLDIYNDNWDELPTLNEGERLVRIITDNPYDELYTIIDDSTDEDDIALALRRKKGRRYHGYVDETYLYEQIEAANKATEEAWDGESWYAILWSDSGQYGEVHWYDTKDDLFADLLSAFDESTETHLPRAEKARQFQQHELDALLGDFKDDFDVEGIIGKATKACSDGNHYWTVDADELVEVLKEFEK